MLRCASEVPHKITIVAFLAGTLNARDDRFGSTLVHRLQQDIEVTNGKL